MHDGNSLNQLAPKISLICLSLTLQSQEPFNLNNIIVEVESFGQISDRDGFHLVSSGFIETSGSSYPETMQDLVKSSKCDFVILEISGIYQGVESLQLPLMVMSRYCNLGKPQN